MGQESMSRDIPFDEEAICDNCGAKGSYDFMGDCYCPVCVQLYDVERDEWVENE